LLWYIAFSTKKTITAGTVMAFVNRGVARWLEPGFGRTLLETARFETELLPSTE
jgi:hypothetical protein